MLVLILVFIAMVIFTLYNIAAINNFYIPVSISNTSYLYKNMYKNGHLIFVGFMFLITFLLAPAWLDITAGISTWSHNFMFLAFWSIAGLGFVGASPLFNDSETENKVHNYAAYFSAASAMLWNLIVCWNTSYILLIIAALVIGTALFTKTLKKCRIYWLEMIVFYSTFANMIINYMF